MNDWKQPLKIEKVDQMELRVYANRSDLGNAAGEAVAVRMRALLQTKQTIRILFAAAPSQNEFLKALIGQEGLDWSRVTVFHMDEYIGLPADAPQRFGLFLDRKLFSIVKPGEVHFIHSSNDIESEIQRYGSLFCERPIDIVCLGIGENGHIAFNDPPVANFEDPAIIKVVDLDNECRQQQVNDGCFSAIEEVPLQALTLTVPALLSGSSLYCMVPGSTKRAALKRTLEDPITTQCPATILRTHPHCTLFTDIECYGMGVK